MKNEDITNTQSSFFRTILTQCLNDTDIENSSEIETYTNKEYPVYRETEQKLKFFDNVLLNKYYNTLKESCTVMELDNKLKHKYNYRPEALSTDHYGNPGFWFIILYINNCECVEEFHDFDRVYLPELGVMLKCLTADEFIKNKDVL